MDHLPRLWAWAGSSSRLLAFLFLLGAFATHVSAQNGQQMAGAPAAPAVTKIDDKRFAELIKPSGKPLLINFWATWCEPCREEFPDLVKIDAEYKGKIDFITISLDYEEELKAAVPKFLSSMKATMPTYLLITPDETAAISMVSKDWSGALPMTVLYSPDGKVAYFRQGIVRHDILQKEIEKLLNPAVSPVVSVRQIVDLPLMRNTLTAADGIKDALNDIKNGEHAIFVYGLLQSSVWQAIEDLQKRYNTTVRGSGCFVPFQGEAYAKAYNRTVIAALTKKHGDEISRTLAFAAQ